MDDDPTTRTKPSCGYWGSSTCASVRRILEMSRSGTATRRADGARMRRFLLHHAIRVEHLGDEGGGVLTVGGDCDDASPSSEGEPSREAHWPDRNCASA